MRTPTLLQTVMMIADLLTLSMSGGLVFATMARANRKPAHYLFALFSIALGGWALLSFLVVLDLLNAAPVDSTSLLIVNLRMALLAIWVLAFYSFVMSFFKVSSRLPKLAAIAALVVIAAALFLTVTGQWIAPYPTVTDAASATLEASVNQQPPLTLAGTLLLIVLTAYSALTFWLLFSEEDPLARLWLLPGALLFFAVGLKIIQSPALTSLDALLVMAAAILMSWSIMWHQPFNPLSELNEELRTANRDLQQLINEVALEKSRTESLNAELRASNEYKTGFLSNISHELRTPLNSIIGYSELLSKNIYGPLNEKQADRLEKIYRNGTHLLELIGHILDLNRLDAGKLQLQMTTFDVRELLMRLRPELDTQVQAAHLSFDMTLTEEPLFIIGDPEQVQQIIQNLIRNAVKLTDKGRITLEAARVEVERGVSVSAGGLELPAIGWLQDGAWVVLTVTDTGSGIAQEDQARIFDEFAHIEGSYTQEYGGSGLLLVLTKRLVTLHDGVIWVRSTLGAGSSFFIALPTDTQKVRRRTSGRPAVYP